MNLFNSIKIQKPKRNLFDLSHDVKLTCNMGQLVPILYEDVVPGDTFNISSEVLCRFAPMIAPVMHNINAYVHYFFVPYRILWDHWEDFITKGVEGDDAPIFPYMELQVPSSEPGSGNTPLSPGTLSDYLGVQVASTPSGGTYERVSAMPYSAYSFIWNEYYRDQNLVGELNYKLNDGSNTVSIQFPTSSSLPPGTVSPAGQIYGMNPLYRCWKKDYFTSALPWTQRGPEVTLPLNGDAAIRYISESGDIPDQGVSAIGTRSGSTNPTFAVTGQNSDTGSAGIGELAVDLSDATSATINELRRSIALQRWAELAARAGSRYIEQIFAFFGVKSSDARLQRPEYLGGMKMPIQISTIYQTSQSTDTSAQANMSGASMSFGTGKSNRKYFEEHGCIMGILSVLPDANYFQGIKRTFKKFDNMDFYFPQFAHLGEQPIYNYEIFANGMPSENNVFGYTPRYAEYKTESSRVCGDFKTNLDFWHLGRKFDSSPGLGFSFVNTYSADFNRIFAVDDTDTTNTDKLWIQVYNHVKAIRPMPKYGTPGII